MTFIKIEKSRHPYIIAEIGNNHNGSIKLAKKTMILAKKNGADCVKFQTFSTNSLFSKQYLKKNIQLKKNSDKYTLKLNDFKNLQNFAKKINIDFVATPFSNKEVDFLAHKLKIKLIKIASMDINNYPFIEHIAKKKIPIILSTGFGSRSEIIKATLLIKKYKTKFAILHCVSEYPPQNNKLNLNRIKLLKKQFKVPIGFSDHTIGTSASVIAMTLGAKIIEKHFTLNKRMKGWDHSISADSKDLKYIANFSKNFNQMLGIKKIYRVESRKNTVIFRRSIVANDNIAKGEKITLSNLNFKRPGDGLNPGEAKKIIGKIALKKIIKDEKISLRFLK